MGRHLIDHDPLPGCRANIVDQAARGLAAPQLAATTPQYCNATGRYGPVFVAPTTSEHAHLCKGTRTVKHPIRARATLVHC
jgi:hypothetical protein